MGYGTQRPLPPSASACYCVIHWSYRDAPPGRKYLKYPSKWLEACVYRSLPEGTPDRWVLAVAADTGPNLLRFLREELTAVTQGKRPDPSLLASAYYCHAVRNAIAHPLLPAQQLIRSLHELAARLPNYEAEALATTLEAAIDERLSQTRRPPEGRGWIASAPQTTHSLPIAFYSPSCATTCSRKSTPPTRIFNDYLKGLSTLAIMSEPSYVTMAELRALFLQDGQSPRPQPPAPQRTSVLRAHGAMALPARPSPVRAGDHHPV